MPKTLWKVKNFHAFAFPEGFCFEDNIMSLLTEYSQMRVRMGIEILNVLDDTVKDHLIEQIKQTAKTNVYEAYTPSFVSRRKENGGLIDEYNMMTEVSGGNVYTLTLKNLTTLQNLFYIDPVSNGDSSLLTPIVEEGVATYHMPFERPFMDEARDIYIDSGEAEKDIITALRTAGF